MGQSRLDSNLEGRAPDGSMHLPAVQRSATPTPAAGRMNADAGAMHNVDPSEVAYYERLANQWWDAQGPFWPLHRLNAFRADFLRQQLCTHFGLPAHGPRPLAGLHVLDVGCGGGLLSETMAAMGASVVGIDVVAKSIRIAAHHASGHDLDVSYMCTTAGAHADEVGARYDVVLNMEVVEHVPDVGALIGDCQALLKPGGVMVVATINRTLKSWLFAIVGAEYIMRWLPRGTHQWARFVTPTELAVHLRASALAPFASHGVNVNPITRAFSLTTSLAVNYMTLAANHAAPRDTLASTTGHPR